MVVEVVLSPLPPAEGSFVAAADAAEVVVSVAVAVGHHMFAGAACTRAEQVQQQRVDGTVEARQATWVGEVAAFEVAALGLGLLHTTALFPLPLRHVAAATAGVVAGWVGRTQLPLALAEKGRLVGTEEAARTQLPLALAEKGRLVGTEEAAHTPLPLVLPERRCRIAVEVLAGQQQARTLFQWLD
jgi:hypothetical protein